MPTFKSSEAKENGWAQVREVIQSFEGDVLKVEFGQWTGKPKADGSGMAEGKEYMDITSINNKVVTTTAEPSMDITATYNFRVNMSDFKGNFWTEKFLPACEKLNILLPNGLQGQHITWKKETHQSIKKGVHSPEFDSTNFVPVAIRGGTVQPAVTQTPVVQTTDAPNAYPMESIINLAIGKTDAQFKSAIGLDPQFVNSPYLSLVKSGAIMQTLLAQGKVKLVANAAGKATYTR